MLLRAVGVAKRPIEVIAAMLVLTVEPLWTGRANVGEFHVDFSDISLVPGILCFLPGDLSSGAHPVPKSCSWRHGSARRSSCLIPAVLKVERNV